MNDKQDIKTKRVAGTPDQPKPFTTRVKIPGRKDRLIGVSDAARWLGCSRQCLGQMAQGTNGYVTQALLDRARAEFPELFSDK
jgi:hypothetical protein